MGSSSPIIATGWLIAVNEAAQDRNLAAVSLVKVDEGFDRSEICNIIEDIDRKYRLYRQGGKLRHDG